MPFNSSIINGASIICGNALERLREFPDNTFHCCITSPPYYSLRDYGTAQWEGGSSNCDHLRPAAHGYRPFETSTLGPKKDGISETNSAHRHEVKRQQYKETCAKCGAIRIDKQIGLEQTPEEYIQKLVGVFREVRRVLRDDGTCWIVIGDSYNAAGRVGHGTRFGYKQGTNRASAAKVDVCRPNADYLKPKDLIGIPWLLAFALRADGWFLRQDIIWHKPNPMPESVTDRCTKAHEYIFLFSKSPRYYFDNEAIKEPCSENSHGSPRNNAGFKNSKIRSDAGYLGRWTREDKEKGRNKRSVWMIVTKPFKEAHFAVMPEALVEPCILAGTSEHGVCSDCGTPWDGGSQLNKRLIEDGRGGDLATKTKRTVGWQPVCDCDALIKPALVLDPFAGAGTVPLVAARLGRHGIGIELNSEYVKLAKERLKSAVLPLFDESKNP
jgi:DNA modification methylase